MSGKIYIITGDVETGKTRWLQSAIDYYCAEDKVVAGVISPGIWQEGKKLGIDAVLLPGCDKFNLAMRNDNNDGFSKKWEFKPEAMNRINEHFSNLVQYDYFVVDELGPLELERGEGLTNAVKILQDGKFSKALIVVRPYLIDKAKELFFNSKIEVLDIKNSPKYDSLF